jgi:hypothetical protein
LIKLGLDIPLPIIIGGLIGFGLIGPFIWPVVLAVSHALLLAWMSESEAKPTRESQVLTGSDQLGFAESR